MASLRGATQITDELQDLASQLHEQLTNGDVDFGLLTELADRLGEAADGAASTFSQLDEILTARVLGDESDGKESRSGGTGAASGGTAEQDGDEPTREGLLERAKEADIPGRSSMSKEELQAALESAEGMTKDELLDEAKKLGISGRSGMTKDQLREAIKAEERVSKEELLERAREADVAGRSEMSKDELREALRGS